jgi:hypothetical protein
MTSSLSLLQTATVKWIVATERLTHLTPKLWREIDYADIFKLSPSMTGEAQCQCMRPSFLLSSSLYWGRYRRHPLHRLYQRRLSQ